MPRKNDAGGPLFTERLLFVTEVSASDLLSLFFYSILEIEFFDDPKRGGGNGDGGGCDGGHSPDTRWK